MVNMEIHLADNAPPSWNRCGSTYAKGCVFFNDEMYQSTKLSELIAAQENRADFISHLQQLNGFFAVAHATGNCIFLAVDPVRSLPLFYGIMDKNVFVSDDARWVQRQLQDEEIDENSAVEFLLTRSVSGSDTLSPSVKQVPAGGTMAISSTPEGVHDEFIRYFKFGNSKLAAEPFEKLFTQTDTILASVFKRLINFAAGRTIVVPLSGGLDSRLIVLMLKRFDYSNVVAFTYGRRGYRESLISRRVAESLGFRWEFVEYSNSSWRRWYESPEWQAYSNFADGLSSTPHIQEWPAVWELKKNSRIPNDSILVPGLMPSLTHSIHKPPVHWLEETVISADEVAGTICDRYFTLQDWSSYRGTFRPGLCRKIKKVLQLPTNLAPELAIEVFDRWWLQTTFSNFLVNAVRVYEFWGYEWWLPLCDLEFVRFSTALPLDLQLQKRFELPYVQRLETDTTSKPPTWNTSDPTLLPSLLKILNALHLRNQARRIRVSLEYDRHHFAWYGIMPERDYMRAFHGKEDINTYMANQTLRKIFPDYTIPDGLDFLA